MQENVGNITFANDGKVEFENASVEINNVELFGDIDVADEDNDPLEISKEVSESSLPKIFQGRVYSALAFSNSTFPSLANVILPTFSCM
jgi:hypothetical protein